MKKQSQPKLRPILFSTPMVQAILEGRKVQTRRIIKDNEAAMQYLKAGMTPEFVASEAYALCRYGAPNDVLWVREKWSPIKNTSGELLGYLHSTDGDLIGQGKWKPSIHMPFEAARIFLRIKSLKVQRLAEISEAEAITEGIFKIDEEAFKYDESPGSFASALSAFRSLWRIINGADSWELNPWVWVIEFERITKEQAMTEVGHA